MDSSTPPGSSRPGDGLRDSGTSHAISASPSSTTGTLMRNTDPHQNRSSSAPPSTGPSTMEMPTDATQMPMARPRSSGSKTCVMIASVDGMTAAAPTPMKARAAISCSGDDA